MVGQIAHARFGQQQLVDQRIETAHHGTHLVLSHHRQMRQRLMTIGHGTHVRCRLLQGAKKIDQECHQGQHQKHADFGAIGDRGR